MGYSSDEFYTQYSDIKAELSLCDKSYFKDKIIYCLFDTWHSDSWHLDSQYIQYFKDMALEYRYKQLVATNEGYTNNYYTYTREGNSYVEASSSCPVENGEFSGDWKSNFCRGLFDKCDMVITTPPSSKYCKLLTLLLQSEKPFLICGSGIQLGSDTLYIDSFVNKKLFLGQSNYGRLFDFKLSSEYSRPNSRETIKFKDGERYVNFSYYNWVTNIPYNVWYPVIDRKGLLENQNAGYDYKEYDNIDGIDVGQIQRLPNDYEGVMGVSVTFMRYYNPDMFDILELVPAGALSTRGMPLKSKRILIKNKQTDRGGSTMEFYKQESVEEKFNSDVEQAYVEEPVDTPMNRESMDTPVQLQEPMERLLGALKELSGSNHGVLLKLDNLRSDTSLDARYIRERVSDIITDMEGLDKKLILFTEECVSECKKVSFLLGIIDKKLDEVLNRLG